MAEITTPVYLFTGFLDSGKSSFIMETLADSGFGDGESILLILCEEGETELNEKDFPDTDLHIRRAGCPEELSPHTLARWKSETSASSVMLEYNGMWKLDALYEALPDGWAVYQEFMFADSTTFLSFNANMRTLVFDKLKSCELVVFNRFVKDGDIMPYHKIVRAANRSCDIAYEHPDGSVRYDDIEDPLPYDLNAPLVSIQDEDFALWYLDMDENPENYDGKTLRFTGYVSQVHDGYFVVGRQMMLCCPEDIEFAGLVAITKGDKPLPGSWISLTAAIKMAKHPDYEEIAPTLKPVSFIPCPPPKEEIATIG